MATPLLAMAPAARAICRGEACTSCWPMADLARAGLSRAKAAAGGNSDRATAGRSRGGAALNPKASASAVSFCAPRSSPIWAKEGLQEMARIVGRGPPPPYPPEFLGHRQPPLGKGSPGD